MLGTRAAAWGALILCLLFSACAKKQTLSSPEPQPIEALPPRYSVCAFDTKGCGGSIEKLSLSHTRNQKEAIILVGQVSAAPAVSKSSRLRRVAQGASALLGNQRPPRT